MDLTAFLIGLATGITMAATLLYLLFRLRTVGKSTHEQALLKLNDLASDLKLERERLSASEKQHLQLADKLQKSVEQNSQSEITIATLRSNLQHSETDYSVLLGAQQKNTETVVKLQTEVNVQYQTVAELNAQTKSLTEQLEIAREIQEKLQQQSALQARELNDLIARNSQLSSQNQSLAEKMATQKTEMEDMHRTAQFQFEKIANQLFEEKSSKFTEANKNNLELLLNPLKDDIGKFKTKVEETYDKESKQRFSLEEKVRELIEQTNKVSTEANNLASALKGQTKKQGNWGEMILESILESSGLTKDREYFLQASIQGEDGRHLRPDVLMKLPDNRVIIIDSKVSLVAYDRFTAAELPEEQQLALAEHQKSIYAHIDGLHEKNYDNLENSLDFTMMFIPIEPAYLLSIQRDQNLWNYAYSKRILLISPTNLIACLKLISDLWNREKQSKNAQEIVKRGELLYEKFIAFTGAMEDLGKHIDKTQSVYRTAIDRLKTGKGNMIAQAIQLKSLGLKSSKTIPPALMPLDAEDLLPDAEENTSDET